MKIIKLKFVDFWDGATSQIQYFIDVLSKRYQVELSDNPDYIIYSGFGIQHLKYDGIRIFYTGECYTPNFNECDYAIGFDRLQFGDRYMRLPLYDIFQYKKDYDSLATRPAFTLEDLKGKTEFCSFVYSNCFAQDLRTQIFEKLSKYKKVNSGGRYRNNIGGAVADKKAFQAKHKFAIAFENTSYNGYCTEKIMEAFAAGCIPIYYGDPQVALDFNPASFINVHDFGSLEEVIDRVKEIDSDIEKYLMMRNANPIESKQLDNGLESFLFHIMDQEKGNAFRRSFSIPAINEEKRQLRHEFFEYKMYRYYRKVRNQIKRMRTGTMLTTKRTK